MGLVSVLARGSCEKSICPVAPTTGASHSSHIRSPSAYPTVACTLLGRVRRTPRAHATVGYASVERTCPQVVLCGGRVGDLVTFGLSEEVRDRSTSGSQVALRLG